jgi:TIR domain-containing protein
MTRSNNGIIVNGGSVNATTLAVGANAKAISIGTREPVYSAEPANSGSPEPLAHAAGELSSGFESQAATEHEWDAFISHAHEDKGFVAPLVRALQQRGIKVWYDDVSLRIGNSLRESIDLAIVQSRFGIVVFSRNYFSKDWTRQEVNAFVSREVGGLHVVLPIWHKVSPAEVLRFSPILADRVAAQSSEDLEVVVDKLVHAICSPQPARLKI